MVPDAIRDCRRQQEVPKQSLDSEPAHQLTRCLSCSDLLSSHSTSSNQESRVSPNAIRAERSEQETDRARFRTFSRNYVFYRTGWSRMQSGIAAGNKRSQSNRSIQNQHTNCAQATTANPRRADPASSPHQTLPQMLPFPHLLRASLLPQPLPAEPSPSTCLRYPSGRSTVAAGHE